MRPALFLVALAGCGWWVVHPSGSLPIVDADAATFEAFVWVSSL